MAGLNQRSSLAILPGSVMERIRRMPRLVPGCLVCLISLTAMGARGETVAVDSKEALIQAAHAAMPGDVIQIEEGSYPGGVYLSGIHGTKEKPIVIETAGKGSAIFTGSKGGKSGLHLSACSHVTLRRMTVTGFPINGINADDGGDSDRPSVGLQFEFLTITRIGPQGNHDALKLSGLTDFSVRHCVFHGWGGSAIDMVGCHDGRISNCGFTGEANYSQANGIQMKGGSSRIVVEDSVFDRAGQRSINLGGGTGLPYFRPADAAWEARDIEVRSNLFIGSLAPIAWVGIDGGHVHHNTIYLPEKWVARILQENTNPRFGRCRNGRFENNLIVFDRRVQTFVNVGGHTEPNTFNFRNNAWFDQDNPNRGPSDLPVEESGSVIGLDPEFPDPARQDFTIRSKDPRLKGVGFDYRAPSSEASEN